ncbi:MAG: ATP-binding cassette domain-containing protein [Bacteroidales bacterium]|jgi:subfamily B ATP-binding cassette protein MsbA|nr:ATP-binding cassette domain-containing protein [Bacteroidales bacterium]
MKDIIVLLPYLLKYKKYLFLVLICNIFGAIFSFGTIAVIIPFLNILFGVNPEVSTAVPFELTAASLGNNANYLITLIIHHYGQSGTLLFICIFIVLITLLKSVFEYLSSYFNIPVVNGVPRDIYAQTFKKILELPVFYFSNERKGDIMARMSADISEVRNSMTASFTAFIKNPLYIIVYLVGIFLISWKMTLIIIALLPITGYITGKIGKSLKRVSHTAQKLQGDILVFIDETLTGLKIINVFHGEKQVYSRFQHNNQEYFRNMNRSNRRQSLSHPLTETLTFVSLSFAIYYGGNLVLQHDSDLSAAKFIGYLLAFALIVSPAKALTGAFYGIKKGAASVDRIKMILDAEASIVDAPNAKSIKTFTQAVEFNHITFSYNGEKIVLNDFNLRLGKGKSVALVGQSGSGKTTVANLLPRFYEISQGDILIDGTSIKDYKLADLRGLLGIVPQESILFNDTFFNNIAFGIENPDPAKVEEAARLANAHDFIMETAAGYQTNIGDQGGKLSGGQRQRLCIARAIMKNPQILILDEATSALDTHSERLVQDALENLMKDRTSLIIAHRLSTIKNADLIVVLNEGRVVEQGTHTELVTANGAYKKLHDLQLI